MPSLSTHKASVPLTTAATTGITGSATTTPLSVATSSEPNTVSSSTPQQGNNLSLPGVTLETLKTLCRLPEADFIRIPMPAMLMTIVHFLRTNKWTGNSADLPALLRQAQEALAKNTLTNVTGPRLLVVANIIMFPPIYRSRPLHPLSRQLRFLQILMY